MPKGAAEGFVRVGERREIEKARAMRGSGMGSRELLAVPFPSPRPLPEERVTGLPREHAGTRLLAPTRRVFAKKEEKMKRPKVARLLSRAEALNYRLRPIP